MSSVGYIICLLKAKDLNRVQIFLCIIQVIIAFIVGSHINHGITNDFAYIGRPLLMGTVALGGIPFVMPFSFSKIKYTHTQVRELYILKKKILASVLCS